MNKEEIEVVELTKEDYDVLIGIMKGISIPITDINQEEAIGINKVFGKIVKLRKAMQ